MRLSHRAADCVHEVCLAQAHTAIEEERVVRLARRVGHGPAGGVREATRVAHNEGGEGEVRIQARFIGAELSLRERRQRVGIRLGLVGRRSCRRIYGDRDVTVVAEDPGEGLADERDVSLGQPVTSEACGHTDGEHSAVELNEHGVREPGLISWPRQLKPQLLLSDLPHLLRIESRRRGGAVPVCRGHLVHERPRRAALNGDIDSPRTGRTPHCSSAPGTYPQVVHKRG